MEQSINTLLVSPQGIVLAVDPEPTNPHMSYGTVVPFQEATYRQRVIALYAKHNLVPLGVNS